MRNCRGPSYSIASKEGMDHVPATKRAAEAHKTKLPCHEQVQRLGMSSFGNAARLADTP